MKRWITLAILLAAGTGGYAHQAGVPVLTSAFDSGLEGWTVTPGVGTPPVAWAADATPVAPAAPGSPPNSLNFNDGVDFSNGVTVSGSATSPVVNLAGATTATLTFVCMYQTETTSATSTFDQRRVQMSTDNFAGTPPVNTQLGATGTSPCPAMLSWHTHSFPVPTALLAANFRIRFFFNSGDSIANTGQGWFVDNVLLSATGISAPGGGGGSGFGAGGASRDNSNGDQGINDLFCGGSAGDTAGLVALVAAFTLVLMAGGRRGRWLAVAALFVLAGGGAASIQSTSTPLNANFDTGLAGWTTTAPIGSPPCGWFADATPAASVAPGSPPNSLNFNDGTDFDVPGLATSGSATSPPVSLAGATSATLTFVCMYQTETTGTGFDARNVQMDTNGFAGTPPFNTALSGTSLTSPCAAMLTWHTHSFPVPAALLTANFQVRFTFNSGDSILNAFQGWFVDNVVVTATGIAPPPPPPPPPGGGTGAPAGIEDAPSRTDPLCGGGAHGAAALLILALAAITALALTRASAPRA
jgi:hypothetical protein